MVAVRCCRRPRWLALLSAASLLGMVSAAMAQSAVQPTSRDKSAQLPSFLDKSRVSDLVAARAALGSEMSAVEIAEQERQAEARLMSETDVLAKRAEEERALAAQIRAKAEALSQRFAEELSQEKKPKPAKAVAAAGAVTTTGSLPASVPAAATVVTVAASEPPRVGSAVQDERAAQAMQRAADALARARSTLDEADRRVAEHQVGPLGAWEKVKAEFTEARRRAAEAVESAQKALSGAPSAVAAVAETSPEAGGDVDPRKTLPKPFALGGTLR